MPKTLVLDFDGVIHSYISGWKGIDNIPDPPVAGVREWARKMVANGYTIAINSTRCQTLDGKVAVEKYLMKNGWILDDNTYVTDKKVPAYLYIDDRAWPFTGAESLPSVKQVEEFKPWKISRTKS